MGFPDGRVSHLILAFAKVPDRLRSLRLGATVLGLTATGLAVVASWSSPAGLIVGTAVPALGVTFCTPAFFSAVFATASPDPRGAASGTASACIDLGFGAGPVALGLVAESAGIPWTFGVAAGVALAGSVWTLTLFGRVARPGRSPVAAV